MERLPKLRAGELATEKEIRETAIIDLHLVVQASRLPNDAGGTPAPQESRESMIEQQTFRVAGGSSGLEAACVRRLAAAGGRGVIADLRPPADSLLEETGQRFFFHLADVT